MTTAQLKQKLTRAFEQWPAVSPTKLLQLYDAELSLGGPQMVYESIVADIRVTCGNIELAKAAATRPHCSSKQYYTVVVARPSHPVWIFDGTAFGISNSAHFLDLESLLGNVGNAGGCCDQATWAECSPKPAKSQIITASNFCFEMAQNV